MPKTHRRRKAHKVRWGRLAVLLIFVLAALYAAMHCLIRPPEQTAQEPDPQPVEELTPEEQALRSHQERKTDFYTILISGVDDNNGGSDTNILVAVDAANGSIYGVSIPRDTKAILDGKAHKINYAYNSGGMALMAQTVTEQLGIPVDYTVQVSLQGFVALVDAIGGVNFDVPMDMDYEDPYQDLSIHIKQGYQRLNGEDALKVVRFRKGYASQDIGRMNTQQEFLKAAAKQVLTPSNLTKLDDFVKIFQSYVETDLTLGNLAWLGKEAISMGADAIEFSTLPNEWKSPYIYLNTEEVMTLVNEHLNPYVEDRVPEDLNIPA